LRSAHTYPAIGISTFAWTSPFAGDDLGLLDKAHGMGFDVLEVAVEQPDLIDAESLRESAHSRGLDLVVCGAFGPGRDLAADDPTVRESGVRYLRRLVELAAAVGSDLVVGPMYSATGKARLVAADQRERERALAADGLRAAADLAAEVGVRLALEPLNRFETDMVNTVDQGLELCDRVDRPNVGLLLDTFHMNIEEKDVAAAIRAAGPRLLHFHACENDRGTPGSGAIDWDTALGSLLDIGYEGAIVIEFFAPGIEEIARATCQWRPLVESGDAVAEEGGAFLRQQLARLREAQPA
jgi:D-psicose/D-tagatose/L-ribulose 3-epimerase